MVKKNETQSLAPGAYGDVKVEKGGTLMLFHDGTSGEYFFKKLDLKEETKLSIDASNGPVTVNAVKKLHFHKDSEVLITHPFDDSGSRFVTFNSLDKVDMHDGARVLGSIIAPGHKVHLHKNVMFQGAICAKDIDIDKDVTFLHHDSNGADPLAKASSLAASPAEEEGTEQDPLTTSVPTEFELAQNYPNPFNPETEIRFGLPEASEVLLRVFNTLGQEIRTLVDRPYQAGFHSVRWDGKDNLGNPVSSGIYFYQIKAGRYVQVKKMSLLR